MAAQEVSAQSNGLVWKVELFCETHTVGTPSEGFTLDNIRDYIMLPVGVHSVAVAAWLFGDGGGDLV